MSRTVLKVCGGGWLVGGWWWLRPILVFSFSLDQAEQLQNNYYLIIPLWYSLYTPTNFKTTKLNSAWHYLLEWISYLTMKVNIAQRMKEESTMERQISNLWKVSLKVGLLRMTMMPMFPVTNIDIRLRFPKPPSIEDISSLRFAIHPWGRSTF